MNAAPAGPKQRLAREGKMARGERGSQGAEGRLEVEVLRERLERAERDARAARGWACLMFGLAAALIVTQGLLITHLGEPRIDESSLQKLILALETRNEREARAAHSPAAPAPLVPAAQGTRVAITPEERPVARPPDLRRTPPVTERPATLVVRRRVVREIPPLPPAASSFFAGEASGPAPPAPVLIQVGEREAGTQSDTPNSSRGEKSALKSAGAVP